jgi:transcriptional regulator with XRE-family HTH domain
MNKPLPAVLPDTLAQRIQYLRQQRDITTRKLAEMALLTEPELLDIEQGITLFLAPHTRQQLCKALRVKPHVIEEVEKPSPLEDMAVDASGLSAQTQLGFLQDLLQQPDVAYTDCPRCDARVQVQRFDRVDMHGHPVHAIKVRCPKCWLKLDHG